MERFKNTTLSDQAGYTVPDINKLNLRNQANTSTTTGSGSIKIPSLQVYQPDFGALKSSFDSILKSYDDFRGATQAQYDANKASLDLSLEDNLRSITETKESNKEEFTKGRQQIAEDIYSQDRTVKAQMSARGLGGSGIEALANLQTRMSAGESISDMAGEFFDAQEKLVQAETDTRENYNVQLQNLNASLQSAMAQIMSQEASSKMDYTQMVDNLKRQVIADTNMARQAQYEWQMAKSQLDEASTITNSMVQQVLEGNVSDEFKLASLKDFGYTEQEAKLMIAQQTESSKAQATSTVQNRIDTLIKLGYSEDDVKADVANLVSQGVDVDWTKLNMGNAKSGTTPAGKALKVGANVLFGNPVSENNPSLWDFFKSSNE